VLRVFTVDECGGNPLGVVTDLAGLDAPAMQQIAADLGFSETVFFDPEDRQPYVRIFTPAAELAFAGHPLVGSGWVLGGQADARGTMRCGVGDIAWRSTPTGAAVDVPFGSMVGRTDVPAGLVKALGAGPIAAGWEVDVPQRYLLVEVAAAGNVADADPVSDAIAVADADGVYVFSREGDQVRARFFAPRLGVDEDPATGSAAAALATVYAATGTGSGALTIRQGPGRGVADLGVSWNGGGITLHGSVREDSPVVLDH
jgi:trans-2,3-dihydro-3-hydroxyanthranilate isomerase